MLVNIISLLILVILVILFAWLARRAWGSKWPILKWLGLVLAGIFTIISLAILVLGSIGFYKLAKRPNNPVVDIQVARTPAQIARGMQLAHICMGCHSPDEKLPLSGANLLARYPLPPIGTLYAPNLTPSGNIKGWTDGEIIRAIREGVHPNGRSLVFMPSKDFHDMSDEDVQAVVAYLRSQPAVGSPTPDNQVNLVGALFLNLTDFRSVQPPVDHVTAVQPGTVAYGEYMVNILGCRGCHGKQLQGRSTGPGIPPAPNITKVLPYWTDAQFITFFNTGQLPGGSSVPLITFRDGFTVPVMPWTEIRAATSDADLMSMYAFLHSLKPIDGPVK